LPPVATSQTIQILDSPKDKIRKNCFHGFI